MFGCLGKIALGLAVGGFVTLGGCALVMSSCTVGLGGVASRALEGIDTEEAVEAFDHGLERLGTLVLASPTRLDGELDRSEDGYSGTYREECHDTTGSCAVFGGTDLDPRTITVTYDLSNSTAGSVRLTLQGTREPVVVAKAGESGEKTFELESGSNYLWLETKDYTGTIDLEVITEITFLPYGTVPPRAFECPIRLIVAYCRFEFERHGV